MDSLIGLDWSVCDEMTDWLMSSGSSETNSSPGQQRRETIDLSYKRLHHADDSFKAAQND